MNVLGKGFADKNIKIKGLRRADLFTKMAVAASKKACTGFEFEDEDTTVSLIVATLFGPHATTFNFLDNILDYSDAGASPTTFSHSVHNTAASYIESALKICGQSLTITSFDDPIKQALILADIWFEFEETKKIIICYVDEKSDPLVYAHEYCVFPSYSKDLILTGAASVLLEKGSTIKIPDKILNPFTFIKEL